MNRIAAFVIAALSVCASANEPPKTAAPFVDRFGAFDAARWEVSDGWANAWYMFSKFRKANVALAPDGVALTLARNPGDKEKPYDGAEFRSRETFLYGRFEARLRAPREPGLVAGFFSYAAATADAPQQEIDIEILGRDTRHVEFTIHGGDKVDSAIAPLPFDAADGFHTYGFEWRKRVVRFYVDGKRVREVRASQFAIPNRPETLYLDLWATERLVKWAGGAPQGPGSWTLTASCIAYAPDGRAPRC